MLDCTSVKFTVKNRESERITTNEKRKKKLALNRKSFHVLPSGAKESNSKESEHDRAKEKIGIRLYLFCANHKTVPTV